MSGFLNKATLIGNLGRDPEIFVTQAGSRIVTLSIATNETWKDPSGERQERVEWHRVVIFNEGLGRIVERHLQSGSKVYLEGKLRTRKWEDDHGTIRYSTEIHLTAYDGKLVFMDGRKREEADDLDGEPGQDSDPIQVSPVEPIPNDRRHAKR